MKLISLFVIPFISRFRCICNTKVQEPFVFPEGYRPNISDSTTYESSDGMNETELDMLIEKSLFYALENISHEELINFDDFFQNKTK